MGVPFEFLRNALHVSCKGRRCAGLFGVFGRLVMTGASGQPIRFAGHVGVICRSCRIF